LRLATTGLVQKAERIIRHVALQAVTDGDEVVGERSKRNNSARDGCERYSSKPVPGQSKRW
jgi:hypothetical protein